MGNAIAIGDVTKHMSVTLLYTQGKSPYCFSKLPLIVGVSLKTEVSIAADVLMGTGYGFEVCTRNLTR